MHRRVMTIGAATRSIAVAVLAVLGIFATGGAEFGPARAALDRNEAANLYEDALARFNDGDIAGAIIQLKNVLQRNPANLSARILIGRAHLARGDALSAEKELRRARVEGGDEELLIVPLANAAYLLDRYDEVLKKYPAEGRSLEVEAGLRIVRGQALLARLEIDKAEKSFDRAAELRPDAAMPKVGLARVYLARSELPAASKMAREAAAAAPDNFFAWAIDGRVARRLGDQDRALESFNKSIALQPDYIPVRVARAMLFVEQDRFDEIQDDLDAISAGDPNDPFGTYIQALLKGRENDAAGFQNGLRRTNTLLRGIARDALRRDPSKLLLAGIVNYALKNYNDAYNFIRKYVQRDRYHAGARTILARLLMRQGKNLDALTHLQVAVKLAPQDAEAWRLLGVAYVRNQRTDEASAAFGKAIELKPMASSLRTVLALSQLRGGKRDKALEGLEEALDKDATAVRPGIMLALIQIRDRKYDAALRTAQKVLARDPGNAIPHNLIATAQWALGNVDAARGSLLRAIELNPNYLSANRNLARLDLERGDVAAAKARLQSMLAMPGVSTRPLLELARIAAREGRFREGISLLTKARERATDTLRIDLGLIDMLSRLGDGPAALRGARKLRDRIPDNPAVMEKLGRTELAFGRAADAAIAFRRLSGLIRGDADRLLWVARLQLRARDLDDAHKTLKRALVVDGTHLGVLEAIIVLEARLKRFDDALFRSKQLVNRLPGRALGERLRGDVLVRMRRYDDAATAYQAAIDRQPSGPLYVRQYLARRNAGADTPPLAPMERWAEANPKDYATRRALAAGYLRAKNSAAARRLYEALSRERPDDPVVLNNLAGLYLEAGDDRALDTAKAAQRLAPRQPQTLDTLGWIYVRRGRAEQGLKLLRDAFSRASRDPTIRYHLAVALSRLGRIKEARAHLLDVLEAPGADDLAADARRLLRTLEGG